MCVYIYIYIYIFFLNIILYVLYIYVTNPRMFLSLFHFCPLFFLFFFAKGSSAYIDNNMNGKSRDSRKQVGKVTSEKSYGMTIMIKFYYSNLKYRKDEWKCIRTKISNDDDDVVYYLNDPIFIYVYFISSPLLSNCL